MKTTFAGTLVKNNVQYYFEIAEDAYIEKTFIVGGNRNDEHCGHFTIEEARKCYRALLRKGFKVRKDDICQPGHGADMNQAFINEELKSSFSPILERLSETGNAMEKTYTFETFANDGHKQVCITVKGYCDNSDCNAPGESYIISKRYVSRNKAREIYKDCLNAGFRKPWYDKIDWSKSDKASK